MPHAWKHLPSISSCTVCGTRSPLDAEGTIGRVAGLGFDGVELAGDYGWPASRWQAVLDKRA